MNREPKAGNDAGSSQGKQGVFMKNAAICGTRGSRTIRDLRAFVLYPPASRYELTSQLHNQTRLVPNADLDTQPEKGSGTTASKSFEYFNALSVFIDSRVRQPNIEATRSATSWRLFPIIISATP